ncbi:MAG: PAS domain S-box protein [Actinomycetota bacterium]
MEKQFDLRSASSSLLLEIIDPYPLTVAPDTKVLDVLQFMSQGRGSQFSLSHFHSSPTGTGKGGRTHLRGSSCAFVTKDSRLLGIFTERDVVKLTAAGKDLAGVVSAVMNPPVFTLKQKELQDAFTVLALLEQDRLESVPVVGDRGELLGAVALETLYQGLQTTYRRLKLRTVAERMQCQVSYAPPTTCVLRLAQLMADSNVSCVVIVDHSYLTTNGLLIPIGMVTERDIVQLQALELNLVQLQAGEVMSQPLFCLSPEDNLWAAEQEMHRWRVRRLAVTGSQGELLGIITQTNLLRSLDPMEIYRAVTIWQQTVGKLEAPTAELQHCTLEREPQAQVRCGAAGALDRCDRQSVGSAPLRSDLSHLAVAEIAPVGIFRSDVQGHYTYVNDCWCKITGLTRPQAMVAGWVQGLHPEDRDRVYAEWHQAVSAHQPFQSEYRFLRSDGIITWVVGQATVEMGVDGSTLGYIGTITDIRSRKLVEAALQESEARYRLITENASDFISRHTADGVYLYASPACRVLLGYEPEELLGRNLYDFFHPEDATAIHRTEQVVGQLPDTYTLSYRHRRRNGEYIWLEMTSRCISYPEVGQPERLIVSRDISERKAAEQVLHQFNEELELMVEERTAAWHESEDRFRKIFEEGPLPMAIFGLDFHFEQVNTALCELLGYSPEELRSLTFAALSHPDEVDLDRQLAQQVFGGSASSYQLEKRYITKNREVVWVSLTACAIRSLSCKPLYGLAIIKDISDRKQAEEALRDSEARFRFLAENCTDIISRQTVEGVITYVSPACRTILGYEPEELIGRSGTELLHPDDSLQWVASYANLPSLPDSFNHTFRVHHRDGRYIWVESLTRTIRDETGSVLETLTTSRDITERKLAEEKLRSSEANLAEAQRIAHVGNWEFDLATKRIIGSAEMFRIFDLDPVQSELSYEQAIKQRIHPTDWVLHREIVTRALEQKQPYELDCRILRADGAIGYIFVKGQPILNADGEVVRLFGTVLDITERKLAEAALRQQVERERVMVAIAQRIRESLNLDNILNTAVAEVQQALQAERVLVYQFSSDMSGTIVAESVVTGWTVALGDRIQDTCFQQKLGAGYSQGNYRAISNIYEANLKACHIKLLERYEVKANLVVPILEQEQVWGLLIAHQCSQFREWQPWEISLLQQLSMQLAIAIQQSELYKQLEVELSERRLAEDLLRQSNERLAIINAELARATRLKDEFLANMSHELRTPLNSIIGLSEALLEEVYGSLTERQNRSLRTIETSGQHLLELINDILDLAKIESGRLELQLESVSVKRLCESSLAFVRQLAQQKQIKITTKISEGIGDVELDERRMRQVIINLLSNAVKFTLEGGSVCLEVTAEPGGESITFSVIDTGIGIAPENMSKLFRSFVQIDSSLSRRYTGTGLGLALVRRITELHGGSVTVVSEVGKGSQFTVTLPWKQSPVLNTAQAEEPSPVAIGNSHTSISEDSTTATEQFCRYLIEVGVLPAIYPQEEGALETAIKIQPTVIILDLQLPPICGWDLLAKLKAHPQTQQIPAIVVSLIDDRTRALELGASEYLIKPITRQQLQSTLAKILREPAIKPTEQTVSAAFQQTALVVIPEIAPKAPLILIAEDNEANIATLWDYLLAQGYRLAVAKNGWEAVKIAKEQNPQLILMDIQMPEMDGLLATQQIRADSETAMIPIIALTALAMPGDKEKCLAAGVNEYFTKPVSLKKLAKTIGELLIRKGT